MMAVTSQRSGKPVSRKSASTQRSMFAQPETSAQQAHAFTSQSKTGTAPQFVAQQRQRSAPSSFFGGNRVPGQTEVQQPNARTVRQRGGQQAQVGKQRRQTSLSEMSSFIARQNHRGGKGARGGGGGFSCAAGSCGGPNDNTGHNFNRSLSQVGAGMARNGGIPPEVQQMAIPFQSSRKKATNKTMQPQAQQKSSPWRGKRGKNALDNAPQVELVNGMKRAQQQQQQQQTSQRSEQQQMQAALSMGVPFKSTARAAPGPFEQQQQQEQPQQRPNVVKPKTVRAPPKVSRETANRFRPIGEHALQSMHSGLMRGGTITQEQFLNPDEEQQPAPSLFDEHVQTIAKKREEMMQKSVAVLDDGPTQFPVSQQKRRNASPDEHEHDYGREHEQQQKPEEQHQEETQSPKLPQE